jgi:hypothetical protein
MNLHEVHVCLAIASKQIFKGRSVMKYNGGVIAETETASAAVGVNVADLDCPFPVSIYCGNIPPSTAMTLLVT